MRVVFFFFFFFCLMVDINFQSLIFIIYSSIIFISLVVNKFFLIPLIKPYFSYLSLYIIIISFLISTDLLVNILYENISDYLMYILLIIDGVLTGTLLALLVRIYSFPWCTFHLILTVIIVLIGNSYQLKKTSLFNHFLENLILILISFLHILYCFLNGLQTYMHRLVALSGMCISFYIILFQEYNIELSIPLPVVVIQIVQSIRAFFLYSVVICVRNRTSYW
jgi:hypothetical protein